LGVVMLRDGTYELIASSTDDPDACTASIPLNGDEAAALANLLGAPQLVASLNAEQEDISGITTRQLPLGSSSPYIGRPLGEAAIRTRTNCSIVAVVRAGTAIPSPGPDFVFGNGDIAVVVGTKDGLKQAARILATSG
jgi:TrkA domain protein